MKYPGYAPVMRVNNKPDFKYDNLTIQKLSRLLGLSIRPVAAVPDQAAMAPS